MKDKERFIRDMSASALGQIKDKSAVKPLIGALKERDKYELGTIVSALSEIKDTRAVTPLIDALKHNKGKNERRIIIKGILDMDYLPAAKRLIAVLKDEDLDIVAEAYPFFIRGGVSGSETILINVLNRYGDAKMAEDFLNCGNHKLLEAAREWAKTHDYFVYPSGGKSDLRWGRTR